MFDYIIRNGTVIDGTGAAPFRAAVAIKDDKIAAICEDENLPAGQVIDAAGLVVCPGFLDMHTHSDATPYCAPGFESAVTQGITFHLAGNCGGSLVPNVEKNHDARGRAQSRQKFLNPICGSDYCAHDVASYRQELSRRDFAINFGTLVGHGTIRSCVMEDDSNPVPTPGELEGMTALADEQLSQGAFGVSLGLTYLPGIYSQTEELTALAKVVARHDSVLTVHMRSESGKAFEALAEMERVAEESGAHIHISHLKLMYAPQWGRVGELLERIDRMRSKGLQISCDQYPYCASSTGFTSLLPRWAKQGNGAATTARLKDDALFEKMRPDIEKSLASRGGPQCVGVAYTCGALPQCDGKTLDQAAEVLKLSCVDAYREILIACSCGASAIYYAMDEKDVLTIAARQDIAVASDGFGYDMLSAGPAGKPHPRSAGTFVRFLRLNRENALMPLEKAVHKMTGLPASILQVEKRGVLAEGNFADITVFDPDTVGDNATFDQPALPASGIRHVFVNGKHAYRDGAFLDRQAGRFLSR